MKTWNISIVVLVLQLAALSCSKEDNVARKNAFEFMDQEYQLYSGIIENYGQIYESDLYNFDVTLFSSGITFDELNNSFSGSGHSLYFEMYTESENELETGSYLFNANKREKNSFYIGRIALNFNYETGEADIFYVTEGTVEVSRSGGNYVFQLYLKLNDQPLSGYYKGPVTEINYVSDEFY